MTEVHHDILLFQSEQDDEFKLEDILHQLSLTPEREYQASALPARLSGLRSPILIAFCGSSEESCLQNTKQLIKQTDIHCYPLIVLGYKVNELSSVLSSYFPISITVPTPFNNAHIFRAINHVKNAYQRLVQVQDAHDKRKEREDLTSAEVSPEVRTAQARADVTVEVAQELEELPAELFEQLKRLNLTGAQLDGRVYTAEIGLSTIRERGYLPKNEATCELIEKLHQSLPEWTAGHLCRMAFICSKITEASKVTAEDLELLRATVFLFASGFQPKDMTLLRDNYYDSQSDSMRKDLCSKIKDSAYKVAVDHNNSAVADVIVQLAQVIGNEAAEMPVRAKKVASLIMVADIVDRTCFRTGYWDPRAAYQLMRKFKAGYMREVDSSVWGCTVKFLSEAISSKTTVCVLPKEMRTNHALIEEAMKVRKSQSAGEDEVQVSIADLTPGMKLARPLISFDGKKILSDEIILDQDLVWRIWQLSAVRPLNPVIIKRERG